MGSSSHDMSVHDIRDMILLHSGLKQYVVTQSLSTWWTPVYRGGHSAADLVNVKLSSIADTLAQVLFIF